MALCLALGGLLVIATGATPSARAEDSVHVEGLGDIGTLESLEITHLGGPTLRGADARQQVVVTGRFTSGQLRDLTSQVSYRTEPAGIVSVDATGLVIPQGEGAAQLFADYQGKQAHVELNVTHFEKPLPINFPNEITPIFTKLGCNAGGCHGKASGQNGFKLSLLGFVPREDYEFLVMEGRGRRLFPAAPEASLLLMKGTNQTPHGGGPKLDADSHEYRKLRRWIAQGMPYGNETDPTVERIEIYPKERTLGRSDHQQLAVIAHFTDGSTEDVTRMTQFEPNDTEMAEVTETGRVKTNDLAGSVAIMARYQSHVAVFRALVPLGVQVAASDLPEPRNFIDEIVFAKLKTLGLPPSQLSNDATFLRRVTVDIAGRLPTADEAEMFLGDQSPDKRDRLIDRLLDSGDYADYFANKWNAVLRNKKSQPVEARGTFAFHMWIRDSLQRNTPYDEFVRSIITASGEVQTNPAVTWYRSVNTTEQRVEDTAQLFLGLRIQCARCHHHPFEKWSEQDYYGFAAFFSQVDQKEAEGGRIARDVKRVYHKVGVAQARNPKTGEMVRPTGLGSATLDLAPADDPRHALVDWMADPTNPFFAKSFSNRYWKHFFGRGLVDPEDDMRVTNPASHPELLDKLAESFIESGFDMKQLIRTICQSKTYQLDSTPNEYNARDKQNFSRYYPQRLNAEVLYDALNQVTQSSPSFNGMPSTMRAVQLPDTSAGNYFLTVFGMPAGDTACECERSGEANLAQSLHLLNSNEVQGKLSSGSGRAANFARNTGASEPEKIREMYLWVFAREPDPDELQICVRHVEEHSNKQQAYEDLLWALVNTKEFLFNH
jgi:hypothetical protein